MKHEVFILGQTIDQKARRDGREARGNEERGEKIEKRSREGIEKETKRQFEEKGGPRDPPPLIKILDPTLRCSLVSSSPESSVAVDQTLSLLHVIKGKGSATRD